MRLKLTFLMLLPILFMQVGCKKCTQYNDFGNPPHRLQLKSQHNQDLWFGSTAIFNPDSVRFIHQNKGILPFTVNYQARAIELVFPPSNQKDLKITMVLTSFDSDNLLYNSREIDEECRAGTMLSYVNYEGKRACTECGDGRFNSSANIVFRKDL